jgi:hypothetical protein
MSQTALLYPSFAKSKTSLHTRSAATTMNVLHPHLSPNRRARPTMSGNGDAKVTTTMMMRSDRAADAPMLPFAAFGRDATLRPGKLSSSSPAISSHGAPSSSGALDANGSRSASGSLASGAALMVSQATKRGPPHPMSRATTATTTTTTKAAAGASTFSSKIAEGLGGGGGRSLHLLFKRSTSHNHRYLSVADGGEGSSDEFVGIMGETTPSAPSPSKEDCTGDPAKVSSSIIVDGSDSLTDEGYDGFAAGSWHSQETLRQPTKASAAAAPASPQSVIIRDAAELEASAACPSTPYSRRRRRRSSMPLMSDAGTMGTTIAETPRSSHHATSLPVACNWTDPARRTLWITSPGSARAHLEFNPRSFVASEDDDDEPDLASSTYHPDVKGTTLPSLKPTSSEVKRHDGPRSRHDDSPAWTGRRRYQRRHSSGSCVVGSGRGGSFPDLGLDDDTRRGAIAVTAASPVACSSVTGNASSSSWHSATTPTPPMESDPVVLSPSPSCSATSSPRRKTRRTATARHITSRRRGRSSSSSIMQHLQVPVV